MKRIVLFLFLIISTLSGYSQIVRNQSYDWKNIQIFSDSVKMDSLYGSGTILKIDENGYIYKSAGTQDTSINISQVLGLQDSLNAKQNIIFAGDSITIRNDSIFWNGVAVNGVSGLIDSLNAKQDLLTAGDYILITNDTISVSSMPVTFITGALDSINTKQDILVAGTNITISNDTISASTSTDSDWTVNGNYVYNTTDSIGIGTVTPTMALDVSGRTNLSNVNTTLTVTNTGAAPAINVISTVAGDALRINNYNVDSVSNDITLAGNDVNDLVTEYAVKGYVDERILNDTRVSWAADVDTTARVNGFVLKWNGATKTHFYDTAGTGGGGSTYFAGAGLELSGTTFSIGADSINTSMIQDDAVTYAKIQNVGGNSVLARTASGSGNLSEVSLSASQLLGRGSSGNVTAISLGSGLTMSGTSLSATNTGDITSVSAGNGLTGGGSSGDVTVTMGTPSTITAYTTNSVTSTSHTHELDASALQANSRSYYLDTARLGDDPFTDGVAITTQEKVICFTMGQTVDSVRLSTGYYDVSANVVIRAVNDDTLAGNTTVGGKVQTYVVKIYKVDEVQGLGNPLSGTATLLESSVVKGNMISIKDVDGNVLEDTLSLTLSSLPIKSRITDGYFYATTISAHYGGVTDFVLHKNAVMRIERSVDYDAALEQEFE